MNHYEKPHTLQFIPPCVPSTHGGKTNLAAVCGIFSPDSYWNLIKSSTLFTAPKVRQILHNMAQRTLFSG